MNETMKWILIGIVALLAIAGIAYFIFKRSKYNYMVKMMRQAKKIQKEKAEAEEKAAAFEKKQLQRSLSEASGILDALGGIENVQAVEQCAIRLRVVLVDPTKANQKALKAAGVSGVLKTAKNLQLIVGDRAEQIYAAIQQDMQL